MKPQPATTLWSLPSTSCPSFSPPSSSWSMLSLLSWWSTWRRATRRPKRRLKWRQSWRWKAGLSWKTWHRGHPSWILWQWAWTGWVQEVPPGGPQENSTGSREETSRWTPPQRTWAETLWTSEQILRHVWSQHWRYYISLRLFHTYALFPLFAILCVFTEKYLVPGTWCHILTTCFYGVPQKADLYCELLKGMI